MVVSEKTERAMLELGLTSYEIKAYSVLVQYGPMTAINISKQSNVPYSKIYDVLGSLEKKGWIETDHSRPSKFYPKPPSTSLETMRMRFDSNRKKNETQVISELSPLFDKRGSKERPDIWIVRGQFNILTKLKEMLESCTTDLMVATPLVLDAVVDLALPLMIALKSKGVRIMVMCTENAGENHMKNISKWGEVRVRSQMFAGGVISDSREVLILLGADEPSSAVAIWADHPSLANFSANYFQYLWNDSKSYSRSSA
ncbi:MAG: TrmB family transcriptional regulator [Thaumarchaeota archaeon]|nr:TrmB family transcriptional regulator [Nitrososphaerota archaeon]